MTTTETRDALSVHVRQALLNEAAFEDNPMSEQGLADRFHVSRTPIRDALAELERDGLVVRRRGKGVHLTRPSTKRISELYDFRAAMESFAVQLLCPRIEEADLDRLDELAERFTAARLAAPRDEPAADMDQANAAFHQHLIELADNAPLQRSMERLNVVVQTFKMAHGVERRAGRRLPPTDYPHEMIVEKLRQRDVDAARQTIEQHILQAKRILFETALGVRFA